MKKNEEYIKVKIVKLMIIGLVVSMSLTAFGAFLYMVEYGSQKLDMASFNYEAPDLHNLHGVIKDAIGLDALSIVQLGIFSLVFLQFFRTLLVLFLFVKMRDRLFTYLSLFTAIILLFSWHNV